MHMNDRTSYMGMHALHMHMYVCDIALGIVGLDFSLCDRYVLAAHCR